jgi:acyl-CoA synthetase (AMP-forming)/AMP-acid ligase II
MEVAPASKVDPLFMCIKNVLKTFPLQQQHIANFCARNLSSPQTYLSSPASADMAIGTSAPGREYPDICSWTLFSQEYDEQRPVLIDAVNPSRFITKAKAIQMIASLAGVFRPDSTVCLHLANDITYPLLFLAILASNARWLGTNIAYTAAELTHIFRTSRTEYVITDAEHYKAARAAVDASGTDAEIVLWTDILANPNQSNLPTLVKASAVRQTFMTQRNIYDLQHNGTLANLASALRNVNGNSIATLMSTSGTTGLPKMAARTHKAHVLESLAMEDKNSEKPYHVTRLFCTPIFHAFSSPEMLINSLRTGSKSYFMKRFDIVLFPEKIAEFGITEIYAPPPMLALLHNKPETHSKIQSLRGIYTGGAPFAPELRARFLSIFDDNPNPPHIRQVYGMTEGGWFCTFKHPINDQTGAIADSQSMHLMDISTTITSVAKMAS